LSPGLILIDDVGATMVSTKEAAEWRPPLP
jgi:hypothetical protein